MNELISAGAIGFLLGLRHALDPDHLVAVSTLVARTKKLGASWLLGAFWGLGHTLTIFGVGALIIVLKWRVPTRLGLAMEFAVGLVLVLLGAWNLKGTTHAHEHDHEDGHGHHLPGEGLEPHTHRHQHSPALERLGQAAEAAGAGRLLRSFSVGLVHGLAGSAAVALLVLAAIPSVAGALVYLAVFGLGTLAGMVCFSGAMELSIYWMGERFHAARRIQAGTGLLSLLFGLYVIYQTGWVDGLFGASPRWDPR